MLLVRGAARRARWTLASMVLAASACTLDDVDYTGKTCPCPSDWVCESDRCARPSPCALRADDVRIGWTTPHAIRWQWTPVGDLDHLGSYRVRVGRGTGPDDASGEPELVTASDNPELGLARIPWSGGEDPVRATTTTGHTADTPYWGQLEVLDDAGCVWTSPPQTRSTKPEPPPERVPLVIFDEDLPADTWLLPATAAIVEDPAQSFAGLRHLRWQPATDDEFNLQIGSLDFPLDVVGADGADLQKTAFLEFAVALDSETNAYYSHVELQAAPEGTGRYARLEPFTVLGHDGWQLIEVALAGMVIDDDGAPFSGADALQKFQFGCSSCELGAGFRVDAVRLRW